MIPAEISEPQKRSLRLVVFLLDDRRYALGLEAVLRVVRIVDITPLPKAPDIVFGVIDVGGVVVPVVDIRRRFNLPEREPKLSDQIIIAHTSRRDVAIVVDAVGGVVERSMEEITAAGSILSHLDYVEGVIGLEDGLVLIHDLDTFLSLEEDRQLDAAVSAM